MNIRDIAKKAGVSVATITRAINPHKRSKVAPKTLEKVDRLIKKYKYTPNLAAQNLKRTSTKTIGIVFPYFKGIFYHGYYNHIVAGVSDYLLNTDYQFKILLLKPEEKNKWDYYDFKKGEHVDGLILENWPYFFSDKSVLERMNIPCVVVSDFREDVQTFFACGDQVDGGRKVAEYLFGLGHRHFAVFTGFDTPDSHLRLQGFRDYLKEKGIQLNARWIIQADFREDMAYEKAGELLKEPERPTAVFASMTKWHLAY